MIRVRAFALLALALGCAALLHETAPADGPWRAPLPWIDERGAAPFAIEVARVLAGVTALYVAALAALAAAHRPRALPAPARLRRAIGLALVGSIAVPATAFATSTTTTDAPVLVLVEPAPRATPAPPATPPTAPAPAVEVAAMPMWRVAPGESFWVIAERVTGADDVTIVDAYWRALVGANLDRLVEPGNPDLLLPGQELVLPPR